MRWIFTMATLMLFGVSCSQCGGSGDAPASARKWAEAHYAGKYTSVECLPRDTDGDGYVSCTVFFKKAGDVIGLECATGRINGDGCSQKGCRVATGKSR